MSLNSILFPHKNTAFVHNNPQHNKKIYKQIT